MEGGREKGDSGIRMGKKCGRMVVGGLGRCEVGQEKRELQGRGSDTISSLKMQSVGDLPLRLLC